MTIIDNCAWEFDGWNDRLATSGLSAFNLTVASKHEDFHGAVANIERTRALVARHADHVAFVLEPDDLARHQRDGRVGIVLHFQNARPLGDDPERLDTFRALGVRIVQLTYNERNFVGDGCLEPGNAGLSRFGRRLVREMNRRGLTIDLTHVGERSSLEAIDLSARPCVFTHANPRARADNPRNISDAQIRACAERGGVIGVCGWGPISWTGSAEPPGLDDIADHLDHIAELVGPDHVAVATDAPVTDNLAEITAHFGDINRAYPEVTEAFVTAFGNTLEHRYPLPLGSLPQLARHLAARGWSDSDVEKAMGANMVRIWRETWTPQGADA